MKRIVMAALLAAPLAAFAAGGNMDQSCSMKASKTAKKSELLKEAKIKEAEAKKIALGEAKGGSIVKGGIETEDGCLVYSYHVRHADKTQTEVFVDAGNGKVLKTEKEGSLRAAVEKPVDKTKELAGRTKEATTGEPSTNQAMKK
jgi:uncharacterized membrane protein YkoI